jgi:hypothetical protein
LLIKLKEIKMTRFNTNSPVVNTESSSISKEDAQKLISDKIEQAYALIRECEGLATEHGLYFSFDLEYGMGGSFDEGEWHPSSQSC